MTGWSARALEWKARGLLVLGGVMMLAVVVSGGSGHGPTGFALAAVGFVVARLIAKPWLVTRLGDPGGLRAVSGEIAGQVALVLVLFWLGVGVAVFTGWAPNYPVWGPVFVILPAAWVSRLMWRPIPPEMAHFLDEATDTLTRMSADLSADADTDRAGAAVARLTAALDALPETGAPHHSIGDAALPPMGDMAVWTYTNTLFARACATQTDRDIRALVIGITDPWLAPKALGQEDLDAAFDLVAEHGGEAALYCFEMQTVALLDSFPEARRDMPSPDRLRGFAEGLHGEVSDRYRDLAALVERLNNKAQSE